MKTGKQMKSVNGLDEKEGAGQDRQTTARPQQQTTIITSTGKGAMTLSQVTALAAFIRSLKALTS